MSYEKNDIYAGTLDFYLPTRLEPPFGAILESMSLRFRLTLLYSAILALTLIVFGAGLYITLSRLTVGVLTDRLVEESRQITSAAEFRLDRIVLPASRFASRDTFVQTRTLTGSITDRSNNLMGFSLPLSAECLQSVQSGQTCTEVGTIENERLLIHNEPLTIGGNTVGIVQVARTLAGQEHALRTLQRLLVIGGSLVTVMAFGVGWFLSGAALRPIDRITQTAQAIGAERAFGRRIEYEGPQDEVGRLAITLNSMLAELHAAYQQIEQSLQAQRRFVADASHELRTPLTTIRGNLGLLQREPPIESEDRVAVVEDMVGETERLMRLVNDLLVLARADAGQSSKAEIVPVAPLIDDVCRNVRAIQPDRPIQCDAQSDLAIIAQRDAVKQVLLILLDNALKHTPAHSRLYVTAQPSDQHVAISVRDTGPGIDPTVLPHIFERFYRGDAARTGSGAGLGLAIAKTLVEAQGGTLTVQSEVDHGSTFTVTLPRAAKYSHDELELMTDSSEANVPADQH
jgi:two-component system OmpR family sensor kinase